MSDDAIKVDFMLGADDWHRPPMDQRRSIHERVQAVQNDFEASVALAEQLIAEGVFNEIEVVQRQRERRQTIRRNDESPAASRS